MPYPKLAEGNRVFDAVFDAETNFADWNELQDQLKGMLGPLTYKIPIISPNTGTGAVATWDYYSDATDPPFWQTTTDTDTVRIPIPWIRTGMKMTALYACVYGDYAGDGGADGSITLKRHLVNYAGAAPAAWSAAIATLDSVTLQPWRGGAYKVVNAGALTLTLDGTYDYALFFTSSTGGTMTACRILGAYATVQFGA